MNVLIAHNDYGRPSGEEHALKSIATLLQANGHNVSWFLRSSAEIKSAAKKVDAFFAGIRSPGSRRLMEALLAGKRFDLVHAQNLYPFLSPTILSACRRRNVPVVMRCPNYRLFCPSALHLSRGELCERCLGGKEYWCVLRNCERDLFKSFGYALRCATARITRQIIDNVSVFIVLSKFQKQRYVNGGIEPERIEILPNIIPALSTHPGEGLGDWVTFVGRASPEKGIEDFLAAARLAPNLPFAVVGATERMPHLLTQSPGNVKWLGFLSHQDLEDAFHRSRIVVTPSRCFEGFPNAVAHAMAAAKPVVASRLGGMGEIVADGRTGLLFEAGNVEEMAEHIRTLYQDHALCREMGRAGRLKAQAEYSPEVVYDRLMQIYQKALSHAV